MDKNLHNIEDLFKKGLEGNEESPSEEVWNSIDQSLEKANSLKFRKKYYSLKRATAILVVMLALLSVYVWRNQSNKQIENKSNNQKNIVANEKPLEKTETSPAEKKAESIHKSADESDMAETKKSTSSSKNIISNTPQVKANEAIGAKPNRNDATGNLKPTTGTSNVTANASRETSAPKVNRAEQESILVTQQKPDYQPGIMSSKEKNEIAVNTDQTIVAPPAVTFEPLPIVSFNGITALKGASKVSPYLAPQRIMNNTPTHIKAPTRFYASPFYSPDIAFSHLRDEDHHFGNPYSRELEKNESANYSYSFGISIGYHLNRKWSLQSGINLSTINMHLEPEEIYAERDNQGTVKYTINTSSGKGYVLPSFSNNPRIGDSLFTNNIKHSLEYTGIPLAATYNLTNGRFSVDLLGGLSANILSNGKISTEVKSGNERETDKTHEIHGLKTFYVSGVAGLGFDYNFYRNLSLSFSPTLNFAIDPINKNVPVRSYPGTVNFQFGLKTEF